MRPPSSLSSRAGANDDASGNRRPRILVVEDDATASDTFARILSAGGYAVAVATDAPSAIEHVRSATPDAIVLDLHLPLVDGLEFLRRARTDPMGRQIPVAVVTADYFLEESTATEFQTLGARIYFKPVWEDDLLQLVRELIGQAAL